MFFQVEYEVRANRPIIRVFPWGDRKRTVLEQEGKPYWSVFRFEPYFYCREDDQDPPGALRVEHGFQALDGAALKKIVATVPAEVPILRKDVTHYEADLLFPYRYIVDRVKELPHSEPDVLYLDIEMAAKRGLPDPLNPVDPIIAMWAYNSAYKHFDGFAWHPRLGLTIAETRGSTLRTFRTEADLLRSFAQYVHATCPDVWTGWNLIDFDARCLMGRFVRCGIQPGRLSPMGSTWMTREGEPIVKGVVLFDLMAAYKAFKNRDFDSLSLEATAQRELGVGKRPIDKSRIAQIWEENPREVIEYCRSDVELIVRLDRKLRLIEYWNELHERTGVQLGDLINWRRKKLHGAHIVETYLMRNTTKILKSHTHLNAPFDLQGANPLPPQRGLHKNIINLDVSSLYPSIIYTFNLSPDSLRFDGEENVDTSLHLEETWTFRHEDHLGELPRLIDLLFKEKDKYHKLRNEQEPGSDEYQLYDRRRYVYKQILNAFQGSSSQPSSRIFEQHIAYDITWAGRAMMDIAARKVIELGHDLIGGHTDSVFFSVKTDDLEEQVNIGAQVATDLSREFRRWASGRGVSPQNVRLRSELAGIAKTGFFHAKTMYALKMSWKGDEVTGKPDDEVVVAGFQSQRSDYPRVMRQLMDGFLRSILDGMSPDAAAEPVMSKLYEIAHGKVPAAEVAIPKGLGQAIGSYRNHSPWDKGAAWSNKHLTTVRFAAGSKPKLLYVKSVPPDMEPTPVVCIDSDVDVLPGIEVDWVVMADKIRQGFRGVVTALGLEPKTFLTPQANLEMWA